MKKQLYTLLFTVISLFANATIHTINVSNFQFSPQVLQVAVGDTVRFVWISGSHTTTSQTVPSGAASWDVPLNSGSTTFDYEVAVPGNYGYVCTPHASMGMAGGFVATVTGISSITNPELNVRLNAEKQLTLLVQLPKSVNVDFAVVDMLGRVIKMEDRQNQSAGYQEYTVNVSDLNAGYYFVRLNAGEKALTRRIYIN